MKIKVPKSIVQMYIKSSCSPSIEKHHEHIHNMTEIMC